jgi:hypothetical protein
LGTEERKAFLKRHHIALYDVIWECDIQASSDSSIRNAVPNDLSLIRKQAKIQAVFTTGKTASRLYREYDGEDNIELPSPSAANAAMSLLKLKEAYSVILPYGPVAHLGERIVRNDEVAGSIPVRSTKRSISELNLPRRGLRWD